MRIGILAIALAGLLAACSPQQFETAPVTVQTAQGPVVCQLYTRNRLDWDRAISRPEGMTVEQADTICRNEGIRQKNG